MIRDAEPTRERDGERGRWRECVMDGELEDGRERWRERNGGVQRRRERERGMEGTTLRDIET